MKRTENFQFAKDKADVTEAIRTRLQNVIPDIEWPIHAPLIDAIHKLKSEKNAILLAHNYQTPEIFHGVADYTGDSLGLAQIARKTDAEVIVMCGVEFMAETAKILNPEKKVLIPDQRAGCSLAESISGQDVRNLKKRYPNVPVVTYVNTSAEVKAESDVCCTSANAIEIVEALNSDRVIFLPDNYLGKYVADNTDVEVILWEGTCEVHEKFSAKELQDYRSSIPELKIIAHPECPPEVLAEADFVGSTAGMIKYVDHERPSSVAMITECSMSDNVAVEFPSIQFIRPCNLCPHMKQITLPKILASLQELKFEIQVDSLTADRAFTAVNRMLDFSKK